MPKPTLSKRCSPSNLIKLMLAVLALLALTHCPGCVGQHEKEVIVYSALDKEFSQPILKQFESQTGIKVLAKFDVESQKTVGLANEIVQTQKRPRADVFWNNEILHTLRLKKLGLLDVYRSKHADHFAASFVSETDHWHGLAARARVLIVNTDLIPDAKDRPTSIHDLVDPHWQNRCGIAKPLFGTSATHATVLFDRWGAETAEAFFTKVKENAIVESGNKQVAIHVAQGRYAWGITDTDDAIIEIDRGQPVVMVFPDQDVDQEGTLLIPNTLAIVKGGPNAKQARQLVDFLLEGKVEKQLAEGRSAQFPLSENVSTVSRADPEGLRIMQVDFESAADSWETATKFLADQFR